MSKKLLTIGISAVVGTVMLGTAAFAALSGTSGYDVYKTAFNNSFFAKSMTQKNQISVQDNGSLLMSVDSVMKKNKDTKTMSESTTVTAGDQKASTDVFRQEGKSIIKDSTSDVYNVMERKNGSKPEANDDREASKIKDIEGVIDALTVNIQDFIPVNTNPDGTKEVFLQLSENQTSPVVNAVASLAIKNMDGEEHHDQQTVGNGNEAAQLERSFKDKLPKLVDGIKIAKVDVHAKIGADNLIQSQTEKITISGKDAAGTTHNVVVSVSTDLSDYNSTTPDSVDLTGKQTKVISETGRHKGDGM